MSAKVIADLFKCYCAFLRAIDWKTSLLNSRSLKPPAFLFYPSEFNSILEKLEKGD